MATGMSGIPNRELMRCYGTEKFFLRKTANLDETVMRYARNIMRGGVMAGRTNNEQVDFDTQRHHAALMNAEFRRIREERMRPATETMRHARVGVVLRNRPGDGDSEFGDLGMGGGLGMPMLAPNGPHPMYGQDIPMGMDEGMIRMASAIGSDMAYYSMDKDAGIFNTMAKGLSSFGKNISSTVSRLRQAPIKAVSQNLAAKVPLIPKVPGTSSAAAFKAAPLPKPGTTPQPGLAQARREARGGTVKPPTQSPDTNSVAPGVKPPAEGPYRTPAAGSVQPPAAHTAPSPAAPGQTPTAQTGTTTPVAQPGSPTGKPEPPGDIERLGKELGDGKWMSKLPMLGAMGLGAYGLHKAVSGGLNRLGQEQQADTYGGGALPVTGINQYGYAAR